MNSSLVKQLNQINQNIIDIHNKIQSLNDTIICNNDIKCDTIVCNNSSINNLSQILGNLNIFGNLHLDNTKFYLNETCYLFMKENQLCFNNGEKDMLVSLTELN
jgi:hypothetical protein